MNSGGKKLRLLALALLYQAAFAQPTPRSTPEDAGIYTCINDQGRRLTSDRPIAECLHKEQRLLNRDGSLRGIRPPTLTGAERVEKEAQERRAAETRAAQADAVRRDRNLVSRYPDQAAHERARSAALDTVRLAIGASAQRLQTLRLDRRPLTEEAEFYAGKPLPARLKSQLDANDTALSALRSAMQAQEAELARINSLYDAELGYLRRLWAGAAPGSLDSVAYPAAPASRPTR